MIFTAYCECMLERVPLLYGEVKAQRKHASGIIIYYIPLPITHKFTSFTNNVHGTKLGFIIAIALKYEESHHYPARCDVSNVQLGLI